MSSSLCKFIRVCLKGSLSRKAQAQAGRPLLLPPWWRCARPAAWPTSAPRGHRYCDHVWPGQPLRTLTSPPQFGQRASGGQMQSLRMPHPSTPLHCTRSLFRALPTTTCAPFGGPASAETCVGSCCPRHSPVGQRSQMTHGTQIEDRACRPGRAQTPMLSSSSCSPEPCGCWSERADCTQRPMKPSE